MFSLTKILWELSIGLIVMVYLLTETDTKVGYNEREHCWSFQCSEAASVGCLQRNYKTVLVRESEWCHPDDFCFVTDLWDGMCIKRTATFLKPLYPGERCNATNLDWDGYSPTHECSYGPQKCDPIQKMCLGWGINQPCKTTGDCNPGLYCSVNKYCQPLVEPAGVCKYDEDCGHYHFCHTKGFRGSHGQCAPWLGMQVGEKVTFKSPSGDNWSDYNSHWKCESYYVNDTGHCDLGFQVAKKAGDCLSSKDCATSLNTTHHCACSMGPSGGKICDAGPMDLEWVEARQKFEKYLRGTPYCHTARRLGSCERDDLFYEW
jgi:hypothetical protein